MILRTTAKGLRQVLFVCLPYVVTLQNATKFGTNHNRLSPALNMQARWCDGQSLSNRLVRAAMHRTLYDTSSQLDFLRFTN